MLRKVNLTGEQKKILFLPYDAPIQIKGVAGSGKTTVAIYRAKHFLETQGFFAGDAEVAIFTYTKTLIKYLKSLSNKVDTVEGVDQNTSGLDATITHFHKWAYHFINRYRSRPDVIQESTQKRVLEDILYDLQSSYDQNILNKRAQFFIDEISWIKGKLIDDWDTYSNIPRTGRGRKDRVTGDDRKYIWKVYKRYQSYLDDRGKQDFDDFAIIALDILNSLKNPPQFDHIVIDEAQDLSKAQMIVLSNLVPEERKSITIIADAAQRIYKSGFSWKEVGISVAGGRTHELSKNYRNNVNIVRAAKSLLDHEEDQSEFTKVSTALKSEKKPELIFCSTQHKQYQAIIDKVKDIKSKITKSDIVVLHRSRKGLKEIEEYLYSNGIDYISYKNLENYDYDSGKVITCTMSSAKGLEFGHVLIADVNDDAIPDPKRYADDEDELHESTERRLLYTAMTRAQDQLYLFCTSGKESQFISELNHDYFEVEKDSDDTTSSVDLNEDFDDIDDDLPF